MPIKISSEELISQAEQMRSLRNQYEAFFSNVLNNLNQVNKNWSENLSNNFSGKIVSAQKSFATIIDVLDFGADSAIQSANTFTDIDKALSVGINGSFTGGVGKTEGFPEIEDDPYDLLEKALDILGAGDGPVPAAFDFFGEIYKGIKKIAEYGEPDFGILSPIMESFFKATGKSIDIFKELIKDKSELFGQLSGLFKMTAGVAALEGAKSFDDRLDAIDDIGSGAGKIFSKGNILLGAELNCISSGITYLVGDIAKYSSDNHPITPDEVGDVFADVGLNMGNSLVKGLSCGIVDIDVDRAQVIMESNRDKMYNIIESTGLPTGAQVALNIVGSPIAAVVSAGEYSAEKIAKIMDASINLQEGLQGLVDKIVE